MRDNEIKQILEFVDSALEKVNLEYTHTKLKNILEIKFDKSLFENAAVVYYFKIIEDKIYFLTSNQEWVVAKENIFYDEMASKIGRVLTDTVLNEFSRPILKLPYTTKGNVELNLSLPRDELIAYISKIKDEYDKENSIIKTPNERIEL